MRDMSLTDDRDHGAVFLPILTSCDANYLPYLAVVVASLDASLNDDTEVELTVIHAEIDRESQRLVESCAQRLTLRWFSVDESATWHEAVAPFQRKPHYFRCLLGDVYPESIRRCIYVDADSLVRRDPRALLSADLRGSVVGAALDYFLPRLGDAVAPWERLGLNPEAEYFNSGVLLVDLEAWRREDVGSRVLAVCSVERDYLLAQGRWPQHDQFGLNVVLHEQWTRIDQTWNYLSEMEAADPAIVHYCGGGKPDSATCRPVFSGWYADVLHRTPWGDVDRPRADHGASGTA
ncbi:glycosyltransferase family 8 protein [Ruania albidiflava]|uniref:glycosyltransferase family 8 protein n=1 Tax=Ruania albidiflava TaxID=366586 RepID=UPI00146BF7DB|nr:glycosyltransferase family 8 protein [Ruania albidiflava]